MPSPPPCCLRQAGKQKSPPPPIDTWPNTLTLIPHPYAVPVRSCRVDFEARERTFSSLVVLVGAATTNPTDFFFCFKSAFSSSVSCCSTLSHPRLKKGNCKTHKIHCIDIIYNVYPSEIISCNHIFLLITQKNPSQMDIRDAFRKQELRMLSTVTLIVGNKDCHEFRFSIVRIVISVSNVTSQEIVFGLSK